MKNIKISLLILFVVALFVIPDAFAQNIASQDPDSSRFITTDVENFWKAYDEYFVTKDFKVFQTKYLDAGSVGLKDFTSERIKNAQKLAESVNKRKAQYDSIRNITNHLSSCEEASRKGFYKLKEIYPSAVFPNVYFVIGRWNSGGIATDNGILIGAEVKANEMDVMPNLICHELIHYQQNYSDTSATLLNQCLVEGAADFIGELISGGTINAKAYEFGIQNESTLWEEFIKDMDGNDFKYWLYSGDLAKEKNYPNDLGYFIGYKICESYYKNASDKKLAVYDILNIKDFKKFLKDSKYRQ